MAYAERTLTERLRIFAWQYRYINEKTAGDFIIAAETIEKLSAKVAAYDMEKKVRYRNDGWIRCEEMLPEPGVIVLVNQTYFRKWHEDEEKGAIGIGRRTFPRTEDDVPHWEFQYYRPDFRHIKIFDNCTICPGDEYVTHWMPLPDLPGQIGGVES